jgi:hypothetical protein
MVKAERFVDVENADLMWTGNSTTGGYPSFQDSMGYIWEFG